MAPERVGAAKASQPTDLSMARRILAFLIALAVALPVSVAVPIHAEAGFFDRLFGPPPGPPPSYKKQRRPRNNGGLFGNPFLFGDDPYSDQPPPSYQRKKPRKPAAPSEPALVTVPVQPKDPKARKILVIGDFVAGGLAWGLDQQLANEPKLAVIDKSNDASGLVRADAVDWNKSLPEVLNSEKPDFIVVALGANDRQQMRTGNERWAVRSGPWEKAYTQRVDGMVDTLKVYGKPFFWVSAPPVRTSGASDDMAYLNGLYKPRVEAAGGSFVDIWIGFTNAAGQYISTGPDLDGQIRQLRNSDGINFTRAGRLKLAFYVEREMRQKTGVGVGLVDLLPATSQTATIEVGPDGKKRLVGPVMSLSDPVPGASDVLAGGPQAAAPPAESAQFRMIVKGDPLPTVSGRVDDFAWPGPGAPAAPPADADKVPGPSALDTAGAAAAAVRTN
jgi:hypothetical protein